MNNFTNKKLANKRQRTLLLILFFIVIFLNLINLLLFFTCLILSFSISSAVSFVLWTSFCNDLLFSEEADGYEIYPLGSITGVSGWPFTNHIIEIYCPKTKILDSMQRNYDFIDILVWLRHLSLGFLHWDIS